MRGDGGVAGEGRVVGVQSFIPGVSAPRHYRISTHTGCPTLPLACVLYCYYAGLSCILGCNILRGSFKLHLGV